MRVRSCLELEDAQKILAASVVEAGRLGLAVSISVVDESGIPIAFQRMDGAKPASAFTAVGKALTAALDRRSTRESQKASERRPGVEMFPGYTPVTGGLPIIFGGQCVGAIGVSGAKSEQDEEIALVGLATLFV
jgi:glc operon protein GlcG